MTTVTPKEQKRQRTKSTMVRVFFVPPHVLKQNTEKMLTETTLQVHRYNTVACIQQFDYGK